MQIQKIQANQTIFGTKVKMNPGFIDTVSQCGECARLRKFLKTLEENGCNDVLSIHEVLVQRTNEDGTRGMFSRVFAEVHEMDGNKCKISETVESPVYECGPRGRLHITDIVNLYNKAKESLYDCSTRISKWANYI